MKRQAFTLIELLIAITIVTVVSGGALVYLNNFNASQKLIKSKDEVMSVVKLAQSYAKTRQLPYASMETELKYVQLQMSGNYLVAGANGVGSTFFRTEINNGGMTVTTNPNIIYFWAGDGRLAKDTTGTSYGDSEKATIRVQASGDNDDYGQIEINALGQVNFLGIFH